MLTNGRKATATSEWDVSFQFKDQKFKDQKSVRRYDDNDRDQRDQFPGRSPPPLPDLLQHRDRAPSNSQAWLDRLNPRLQRRNQGLGRFDRKPQC
jgi:hypothetical protein